MPTPNAGPVDPSLTRGQWEKALADAELWEPATAHVEMALANAKLPDGDRRKLSRLQSVNLRAAAECFEAGLMPGLETRARR